MPNFVNQITIGDLIQIIAILIAAIGLFLNFRQLRAGNRQKRAEYIINLHNQYASDKDNLDIYYKIEYDAFEYDENFHKSEDEKKLDKLLDFYDNIAKLYKLNNFTLEDLDYVAYGYLVIYQNPSVTEYLGFLDNWYKRRGMRVRPFSAFRDVGQILEDKYFRKNPTI